MICFLDRKSCHIRTNKKEGTVLIVKDYNPMSIYNDNEVICLMASYVYPENT